MNERCLHKRNIKIAMTIYCWHIKWKLCEKHGFEGTSLWYEHEIDEVVENEGYEILWNYAIQSYTKTEAR